MYGKLITYETGAETLQPEKLEDDQQHKHKYQQQWQQQQYRQQFHQHRKHQPCKYQLKLPAHHRCFRHYLLVSLISVIAIQESLTSHSTLMPFIESGVVAAFPHAIPLGGDDHDGRDGGDGAFVKYTETTTIMLPGNSLPYFDFDVPRNITVTVGQTGFLFCRVARLGDKDVSWIRKRDLHILTAGSTTYTSDQRFQVIRPENSGNWTLQIKYPQPRDSGIYECQINTEPKMSLSYTFNVIELKANIIGPTDLYVKSGSDINLTCKILQGPHELGNIFWYKGNEIIDITTNQNEIDSGNRVAVENDWTDGLTSRLKIHRALSSDTGNYTCVPTIAKSSSVYVHVIIGEHPAAMQHNSSGMYSGNFGISLYCLLLCISLTWCLQHLLTTIASSSGIIRSSDPGYRRGQNNRKSRCSSSSRSNRSNRSSNSGIAPVMATLDARQLMGVRAYKIKSSVYRMTLMAASVGSLGWPHCTTIPPFSPFLHHLHYLQPLPFSKIPTIASARLYSLESFNRHEDRQDQIAHNKR